MAYSQASLISTGIIFAVISILLTALRFWVRLVHSRTPVGPDDWFMVIATATVCALGAMQAYNSVKGPVSVNSEDPNALYVGHQVDYAQVVIEKIAYGSIKLSFLYFYRRVFSYWPSFRKLNNAMIVLIVAWTVAYLIGEIFQCGANPSVLWKHPKIADDVCDKHGAFLLSFAVTDVITDIMVIGLPLPYIGRLQMSQQQMWATYGVFLVGFISTLSGILRLIFVSVNYSLGQLMYNSPPLASPVRINDAIDPVFWTNFECFCGVIAANILPLWPLIRRVARARNHLKSMYRKFSTSHVDSTTMTQHSHELKKGPEAYEATVSHHSNSGSERPLNYRDEYDHDRV